MASVATAGPEGTSYTTSAKEVGAAGGSSKLTNIDIDVAQNGGFSVTCRHRQPAKANSPYIDPDKFAFGNKAELFKFLDEKLTGSSGEDAEAESATAAPIAPAAGAGDIDTE